MMQHLFGVGLAICHYSLFYAVWSEQKRRSCYSQPWTPDRKKRFYYARCNVRSLCIHSQRKHCWSYTTWTRLLCSIIQWCGTGFAHMLSRGTYCSTCIFLCINYSQYVIRKYEKAKEEENDEYLRKLKRAHQIGRNCLDDAMKTKIKNYISERRAQTKSRMYWNALYPLLNYCERFPGDNIGKLFAEFLPKMVNTERLSIDNENYGEGRGTVDRRMEA